MKRYLVAFAVAALGVAALAQDCSPNDAAYIAEAGPAIQRVMANGSPLDSWTERAINRAGDSAAVTILKTWPDDLLESQKKIQTVLFILRMAFPERRATTFCSDREPRITLLLIAHLQHLKNAEQLQSDIEATKTAILKNTGFTGTLVSHQESSSYAYLEWIDKGLRTAAQIKPGMLRKDLKDKFRSPGGFSDGSIFVLKECPLIHIQVKFVPSAKTGNRPTENPDDVILSVSHGYVAWDHMD
jgi:hypothetical protein